MRACAAAVSYATNQMMQDNSPRYCLVIPHYNHEVQLGAWIGELSDLSLPVLVIDDGSNPNSLVRLRMLTERYPWVELIVRTKNGGKGAAMVTGMLAARARGYTHVVGADADGQHAVRDIVRMVEASRAHPRAIVSGLPRFGTDIPRSRLYGRMITTGLAQAQTLSREIKDAMCGLRAYPLDSIEAVRSRSGFRARMEFDPEILVRAIWRGVPVEYLTIDVAYPATGVSHFRLIRDNLRMVWMHIVLTIGALLRLPKLLYRNFTHRSGFAHHD